MLLYFSLHKAEGMFQEQSLLWMVAISGHGSKANSNRMWRQFPVVNAGKHQWLSPCKSPFDSLI